MKTSTSFLIKRSWLFSAIFLFLLFSSCEEDDLGKIVEKQESVIEGISTRGAYNDGYFKWYEINQIITYDKNNQQVLIPLPWEPGGTQSAGIPVEWIDEDAESPSLSERMYSKENGWEMVYSNMNRYNSPNRYFALYNKYTGILRFFFYSIASSSGTGTSSTFIAVNIDKPSSLFNFTNTFADGIEKRGGSPGYIYSPGWIAGVNNKSIGFKENNWYGVEIECAYDPYQELNSKFGIKVWGANVTVTLGQGITNGQISGSIVSTVPSMPSLNLDFSQTTNNKFVLNSQSTEDAVSETIEDGVAKNDPFFKRLWSDIDENITEWIGSGVQKGVKEGIKAVMSSGGSIINKVLGNVFNSLIGRNGKQNVSKVDLVLNTKTDITLNSTQEVVGWGSVSPFPLPASGSEDAPLYDQPLGVWNLQKTPSILISIFKDLHYTNGVFQKCVYHYNYILNYGSTDVVLNEILNSELTMSDFSYDLNIEEVSGRNIIENLTSFTPSAFMEAKKYYKNYSAGVRSKFFTIYGMSYPDSYYVNDSNRPEFKLRIAFDLTNSSTGKVYSFSKYFNVEKINGGIYTNRIDN